MIKLLIPKKYKIRSKMLSLLKMQYEQHSKTPIVEKVLTIEEMQRVTGFSYQELYDNHNYLVVNGYIGCAHVLENEVHHMLIKPTGRIAVIEDIFIIEGRKVVFNVLWKIGAFILGVATIIGALYPIYKDKLGK